MVFSSLVFLFVFLPVTLVLYYYADNKYRNVIMLILSLLFYAYGEPKYVFLMIFSILMNYIFGLLISQVSDKNAYLSKVILMISVIGNISILVYYKYTNFIIRNLNLIFGTSQIIKMQEIVLPIGISFFTFQAMSYVIDVYRKDGEVQKNPLDVGLYVALFPQLIAGPIVRYNDIAKQLHLRVHNFEKFIAGVNRFCIGLSKKILIANYMGAIADEVFAYQTNELSFMVSWIGILAYSFQIYFDFSAYSDMAIGLGNMFGFEFLENFNYPYIAKSIQEFWRRWHISLSSWFRDYLYIPLGGSKEGEHKTYRNLLIVFFATGLWHGASWNFIVWGLFHGIFLLLERSGVINISPKSNSFRYIYTSLVVMTGWVFFRADNLTYAMQYLYAMINVLNFGTFKLIENNYFIIFIPAMIGSTPIIRKVLESKKYGEQLEAMLAFIGFALSVVILIESTYNPFIYFRF